jgi:glutathione synthase/RimK-type ligase-like ATP-grasp enzyme
MKKIGVLHGMERSFPEAFVERINKMGLKDITAAPVQVDVVEQGAPCGFDVIIDRISQDVPFYRAYLKNAASSGTAVINNPFWWSADEKFFNNALALKIGVPVPKTVILPSHEKPTDTQDASFSNLKFPLSWERIFEYIGWPAYMKPHAGGGWKSVYKLRGPDEFFEAYRQTGQLVMMLQEEIIFDDYFRCYCLGRKHIRIMQYEPRNPHHLRYAVEKGPASEKLLKKVHDYVLDLNNALGYDFNTVEMAVRDGIPYAIDFCNPAPDAEVTSVGQENFEWVVEHAAKMAVERAQRHMPGKDNLTWGTFVSDGVASFLSGKTATAVKVKSPVAKAPAKKK